MGRPVYTFKAVLKGFWYCRIYLIFVCSDLHVFLQLAPINKNLEAYYDAWHKYIDSWIVIQVDDPTWVFRWRLQVRTLKYGSLAT